MMTQLPESGCCPRFDPEPWDEREIELHDRLFLKDRVRCLFGIPLSMNRVMTRCMETIYRAGALSQEPLMLYDCKSLWSADVYIAIAKEIPGANMERISGRFLAKVFEGHYKNSGKWRQQMQEYVKNKGVEYSKIYFFYTTCPKCAEFYGKNYTVLLARI